MNISNVFKIHVYVTPNYVNKRIGGVNNISIRSWHFSAVYDTNGLSLNNGYLSLNNGYVCIHHKVALVELAFVEQTADGNVILVI